MCHQTVSLVARHLEAAGIPTVIIGSGRDIVEECGVPRFLFVDFPLGNPCGKPWDVAMQYDIVGGALELLERAWLPRTTVQRPEVWARDEADALWRRRFMQITDENREKLAQAGEARRREQAEQRQKKAAGA